MYSKLLNIFSLCSSESSQVTRRVPHTNDRSSQWWCNNANNVHSQWQCRKCLFQLNFASCWAWCHRFIEYFFYLHMTTRWNHLVMLSSILTTVEHDHIWNVWRPLLSATVPLKNINLPIHSKIKWVVLLGRMFVGFFFSPHFIYVHYSILIFFFPPQRIQTVVAEKGRPVYEFTSAAFCKNHLA